MGGGGGEIEKNIAARGEREGAGERRVVGGTVGEEASLLIFISLARLLPTTLVVAVCLCTIASRVWIRD